MPGWLIRCAADVPAGDAWLSARERRTGAGLRVRRRRRDWRLGRFAAKAAVGSWLSVAPERVEILPAPDGAPEAWVDGERAPVSVSLSHRAGRALAVVAHAPAVVGCDLERVEPRSGAFVREWLAPAEHGLLAAHGEADRARLTNLVWTAKEAAAKVRHAGLRLDVRRAVVAPAGAGAKDGTWRALRVQWDDGCAPTEGWWRAEPGWVMTIAGDPAPPRPIDAPRAPAGG
ncbi:MAG TPA: 4'-phosphopantetheinyl transferase superfamily protein [Solirubrobacteraceae bacterium]|nr:4'-phosphopantetheinyl transferase superfamily protein [Solirubrobacteraceae bacterium]